jgi:hypothetical protein
MSLQSTFDFIVDALVTQGEPSVAPTTPTCQYRIVAPSGKVLKCAVGHLIPDFLYGPQFDGPPGGVPYGNLPDSVRSHLTEQAGKPAKFDDFMAAMQRAHDIPAARSTGPVWVRRFLARAEGVAAQFMLDTDNVRKHIDALYDSEVSEGGDND